MLKSVNQLEFKIKLTTGLHIGGSSDTFDIGGADSTVIKNPLTHQPYIPGSSIKGKIKTLLAYRYGELRDKTLIISDSSILNLFEPVESEAGFSISRAIFRDAYLTEESVNHLQSHLGIGNFTEIKAENKIDPLKGTASNPRFIERVPAGAEFSGEIILHIFDGDDEELLKNTVLEGLNLLKYNYIGGSGTRGYGRVEIETSGFKVINENL